MMFLPFRHSCSESLREGRLIYQQQSVAPTENPQERPQAVLAELKRENPTEEQLVNLERQVARLDETSPAYQEALRGLQEAERPIITANLQRLGGRVESRATTQAEAQDLYLKIVRIRSAITVPSAAPAIPAPAPGARAPERAPAVSPETQRALPEAPVAPAESAVPPETAPAQPPPPQESGWIRQQWDRAAEYWDGVSPQAKAITVGVGAAIAAYGVWRFVRWMWGGTKNVAEKTVEKTKEGMGWFTKTVIGGSLLAVAGVAGFFGIRWLQDFSKRMASGVKDAVKEGAAAAEKEIKAAASKVREEITEHGRAATERVSDAAHAGAVKIDEKKRDLAARWRPSTTSEAAAEGAEASPQRPEAYAPGVAVFLLSKYLKNDKVADVYESLKSRKLRELLATYDSGMQDADPAKLKAFSVVPAGAQGAEAQQYEQAAQKLVAFCGKREPEARVLYNQSRKPTDVPFEELTLEQYVLSLGGGLSLAADAVEFSHDLSSWKPDLRLLERIKDGSLSIGRKMRDLGVSRLSNLSSPLQNIEMKEVMQYLPQLDRGVFVQLSVRSVLADAAKYRLNEEQVAQLPPEEQHKARIRMLVLEICEKALPTGHELAPFFHRTFPDCAWSKDMATNEKVIDQYVQEMSVAQALRFFLYWQMIRSKSSEEQVGGLVALQYEVLQFIDKRDAGYFGGLIKPKFKSAVVGLTEDLASPTFGQALSEVAKVDAAIVRRVCDMLSEPAQRLAYYAGLAALGPVKYLAEWGLGTLEKHPVVAPVVAGTAAYALLPPVRLLTKTPWWWITRKHPTLMARALNSTLPYNPVRWAYSKTFNRGASFAARTEAGSHLAEILGKIRRLPVSEAERDTLHKALSRCLAKGAKDVDLLEFSTAVDGVCSGKPQTIFADLMTDARTLASAPGAERARSALRLYARPFREQVSNLRFVREMRAAGLGGTMLWGGGLAGQGYAAVEDWRRVGELSKEKKEVMTAGVNVLAEIRQKLEQDGRYQMAPDGRSFVHKTSGVVVDLKLAERQLTTVEGSMDSRINAQIGNATASTASFVGLALLGPRLAMGPAGLVVIGVELAIRGGIAVWEQSKMRDFILHSPPWVVAALGLQRTTGVAEEEWLNNASSWMITDVSKWFEITGLWGLRYLADPESADRKWQANEKEKERIRDRALFALFCRDLRQNAPEVIGEIFDGVETPDAMDQFFERDFRSIILPFLSIALFTHSQEPMRWSNAREVDTDSGLGIVPPRMTMPQIRRAMREASVFALQHVREQRYVKLLACRQRFTDEGLGEQWETAMGQTGAQTAFGQRLRESALTGREEKTRTQLLLIEVLNRLNHSRGVAQPSLFVVSADTVPGLPSTLNMRSPTVAFDFIEDPALRLRLSQIHAETLGEEEAEKCQRWNDWGPRLQRSATSQTWVAGLDRLRYSAPFHAANLVAAAIGQQPMHENTSLLDLAGRGADAASFDAARNAMTDGAVELFKKPEISRRTFTRRWTAGAGAMYSEGGPLVFGEYHSAPEMLASGNRSFADQLYHRLRYPDVESQGFEPRNLRAVFFEGRMLGSGHEVVLATYVYGDIASRKISIVRCAGSTYQVNGLPKDTVMGAVRPMALSEFLQERGAQDMLRRVQKEMATVRKAQEHQAQETHASTEQAERERKGQAPDHARQMQKREQQRTQLREQFRGAGMLGYVPGSFVEQAKSQGQEKTFFEGAGGVEGRLQGANISFNLPDSEIGDQPAFSTPSKGPSSLYLSTHFKFRTERDGKPKEYDAILGWMRDPSLALFSPEDLHLIREVLITTIDLSAHPRGREPTFVEAVHKYELKRLLKMAHYRSGAGWNAHEYEYHLFDELWPVYRDTEDKRGFLNRLLNNLLSFEAITGGAFSSPYRTILKNMKG